METVPDGQAGYLTERSEPALTEAVQHLVGRPWQRAEFGEFGRKHVSLNWTWDTAVQCLEDHFQAVVQGDPAVTR